MLSKAKIKHIQSLQIKKFRRINNEFLVEGSKTVLELLISDFKVTTLLVTEPFLKQHYNDLKGSGAELIIVSEEELSKAGAFASNNAALAVATMKENTPQRAEKGELVLILDDVKDPGNLGTIIRIADWYGIQKIICSEETADVYNPKVISSTMGSFTRVNVYYTDLKKFLMDIKGANVYGALLNGTNIYKMNSIDAEGYLLMGNESLGIHQELFPFITHKVSIPRIGMAESLNVAVATAILCDNILRD